MRFKVLDQNLRRRKAKKKGESSGDEPDNVDGDEKKKKQKKEGATSDEAHYQGSKHLFFVVGSERSRAFILWSIYVYVSPITAVT